ncbi:CAP domain-containing protein [Spirillospora sp. NPDC048911]|uniref:CAP domain-containing protein n=1 Tax=Spirillospora sp. NPDC048911 TaxID=3364527 RepID=UPI00371B5B06
MRPLARRQPLTTLALVTAALAATSMATTPAHAAAPAQAAAPAHAAVPAQEAAPPPGFKNQVLTELNHVRAQYGAKPLTWSDALYPDTEEWAKACKYENSQAGGKYGENLFTTTDSNGGIKEAVASWMAEASKYDYNSPGASAATKNFTQTVWKGSTQVAAAIMTCPAQSLLASLTSGDSQFIVARFSPPGNTEGKFAANVGRHD